MNPEQISIMKMDQDDRSLMGIHTLELRTEIKPKMMKRHLKMEMVQLVDISLTPKANKFSKIK
jgi:hypothetical protein